MITIRYDYTPDDNFKAISFNFKDLLMELGERIFFKNEYSIGDVDVYQEGYISDLKNTYKIHNKDIKIEMSKDGYTIGLNQSKFSEEQIEHFNSILLEIASRKFNIKSIDKIGFQFNKQIQTDDFETLKKYITFNDIISTFEVNKLNTFDAMYTFQNDDHEHKIALILDENLKKTTIIMQYIYDYEYFKSNIIELSKIISNFYIHYDKVNKLI